MRASARSSPRPGGIRQSTLSTALEGMTLIFVEALIFVGASVTPSSGSTSIARPGSRARRRSSAAAGSPSGSRPRPSSRARAPSVRSKPGCWACIAASSGAIFSSALSPIFGIDAWPATPSVVRRKRKTPFSATQTP